MEPLDQHPRSRLKLQERNGRRKEGRESRKWPRGSTGEHRGSRGEYKGAQREHERASREQEGAPREHLAQTGVGAGAGRRGLSQRAVTCWPGFGETLYIYTYKYIDIVIRSET